MLTSLPFCSIPSISRTTTSHGMNIAMRRTLLSCTAPHTIQFESYSPSQLDLYPPSLQPRHTLADEVDLARRIPREEPISQWEVRLAIGHHTTCMFALHSQISERPIGPSTAIAVDGGLQVSSSQRKRKRVVENEGGNPVKKHSSRTCQCCKGMACRGRWQVKRCPLVSFVESALRSKLR